MARTVGTLTHAVVHTHTNNETFIGCECMGSINRHVYSLSEVSNHMRTIRINERIGIRSILCMYTSCGNTFKQWRVSVCFLCVCGGYFFLASVDGFIENVNTHTNTPSSYALRNIVHCFSYSHCRRCCSLFLCVLIRKMDFE